MQIKSVTVVGLGYVGLPTAALFANVGYKTIGYDLNEKLIDSLNSGRFISSEPGLSELLEKGVKSGSLSFSAEIKESDVYIIAVPTPLSNDKSPDMGYVLSAAKEISKVIQPGQLVVLESTSPAGSTRQLAKVVAAQRPELDVAGNEETSILFAYCPERVLPGDSVREITHNPRIIGGLTQQATIVTEAFYREAVRGEISLCTSDEAELTKLFENSYRDVNIAFANELARISYDAGVSSQKIIELANKHPRVNILSPGVGVGGHCIPIDPWFLVYGRNSESSIIQSARKVNDGQPELLANQVVEYLELNSTIDRVFCLGLSYKPDSDDSRESPAIGFVRSLSRRVKQQLNVVDPLVSPEVLDRLPAQVLELNQLVNLTNRDLIIIVVGHKAFANLNFGDAEVIDLTQSGQVFSKAALGKNNLVQHDQ